MSFYFTPRIGTKQLAGLSRRLSTSLGAGVDARRTFAREAEAARGPVRAPLGLISDAVNRGGALAEAIYATGDFFPPLFRELVHVGEQTGKLPEVFRQLAEHYDHQLRLRRIFFSAISWPVIQLVLALGVIGLLIFVMGALRKQTGGADLLGWGLLGGSGLAIYLLVLASIAAAGWFVYTSIRRESAWTWPIQRLALRTPRLGSCLKTLAISRLAWSLHVTLESGMELRKSLDMALRSTNTVEFTAHTPRVLAAIRGGQEVHEALAQTGAFPRDFLDAIEVGERSGRLVESLEVVSKQYQEQAQNSLGTITVLAGFGVWALVALMIIMMIFKLAGFYFNALNDAAKF